MSLHASSDLSHLQLNQRQQQAIREIESGKNIFITGPSGVGKSVVIRYFRGNCSDDGVAVTSTTGVSALLLGGATTLHSYLGIGLGTQSVDQMVEHIRKRRYGHKHLKRWLTLTRLIIDEVSMLDPDLFDKLELMARILRGNNLPFGGVQLILTGDFLQLPVVGSSKLCFEAKSWETCQITPVFLTEIVRQPDPEFQQCLNEVRIAQLSPKTVRMLHELSRNVLTETNGIRPTIVYSKKADVDAANSIELDNLNARAAEEGGEGIEFFGYDMVVTLNEGESSAWKDRIIDGIKSKCPAPSRLELCVGAQVMLLTNLNIEEGLVNGSRGVVTGFVEHIPLVRFLGADEILVAHHTWDFYEGDQITASATQIPLQLAWASTIHKLQGVTLDFAVLNLDTIFEYGQAYVALSRVRSRKGLAIRGLKVASIKAHPRALEFYKAHPVEQSQDPPSQDPPAYEPPDSPANEQ